MEQANYFRIITSDVMYCKELSDKEKLLFAEISALTNLKGYCYATDEYFANEDRFNCSVRTVSRLINNLKDLGFLTIETYNEGMVKKRKIKLNIVGGIVKNGNTDIDKNVYSDIDENVYSDIDENVYYNSIIKSNSINEYNNSSLTTNVEEEKPKAKKIIYGASSPYYQLTLHMLSQIRMVNPEFKPDFDDKDTQRWSDDFRKTVEIDKRDVNKIGEIIDKAYRDNFWQSVLQSPSGLRKHYDKLFMKFCKVTQKTKVQEFIQNVDASDF